ncbi:DUF6292 family protein [Haloechinothrix sp. LS1_15]|uniref:DUF6292 family protein n=1 Tax=Haloechinothrix sp. LS1_15 TaxID=2652248 RepID=UPI00294713DD|nr:DUF6292 family protein [Haloechinothrix sp. LS1_15]MDV6011867.1 hypothetical protein [Haloechinothrix sp. LS1_15]
MSAGTGSIDHVEYIDSEGGLRLRSATTAAPHPVTGDERAFGRYVHSVAAAVGVPTHAVLYEVAEYASAYLALDQLATDGSTNLMLTWDEEGGWAIAAEPAPGERATVLARMGGPRLPSPRAVARFVENTLPRTGS